MGPDKRYPFKWVIHLTGIHLERSDCTSLCTEEMQQKARQDHAGLWYTFLVLWVISRCKSSVSEAQCISMLGSGDRLTIRSCSSLSRFSFCAFLSALSKHAPSCKQIKNYKNAQLCRHADPCQLPKILTVTTILTFWPQGRCLPRVSHRLYLQRLWHW